MARKHPLASLFLFTAGVCLAADNVSTFSIVAYDPVNHDWGVAVASRYFSVGAVVPWAEAGVGAVATQANVNVGYGPRGIELLKSGLSAKEVIDRLLAEDKFEGKDGRQVAVADAKGNIAAYTGPKAPTWAGDRQGKNWSAQGNILVGAQVPEAMGKAFEATQGELAEKLFAALKAGDDAGGDSRGRQSASMLVVRKGGGRNTNNDRYIYINVDVDVTVVIGVAPAPFPHHQHRGGLSAARVPACVIPGLQGGEQFFCQFSLRRFECFPHSLRDLSTDKNVALRRPVLPLPVAGPGRGLWTRVGRDVSLCIGDRHLPAILAFELVFGQQSVNDLLGGQSRLEQFDTARTIAYIHVGLRGDRAHAGLGPRDYGADRKVTGGDGDTPVMIHRIVGDNRKSRDIVGGKADPRRE